MDKMTAELHQPEGYLVASKSWWLGALGSAPCACLLITLAATSVQAQEAIEEVIVTGSYIKGTVDNAPNPVSVLNREDLLRQGSPTILDIVKELTISSGVDGETNQFTSNGLEGSANINLRGLGPARTLTLFNGKRLPYSGIAISQAGYQQFVNTNFIPTVALASVEFLKEGASATYGSDAVAGVANFITRSDFEGFEISANHKVVEDSDGWNEIGLAFGRSFNNGGHLLLAAGYNTRGELQIRDRDYALRPYNENPSGGWSGLGNPGQSLDFSGPTGVGLGFQDPGCNNFIGLNGNQCRFQYTQYDNLIEEEERYQVYGEYDYTFANDSKITISALWGRVNIPEWKTSPSYPPAATFLANIVPNNHPGFVQLVNDVNAGNHQNGYCSVSAGSTNPEARVWLANFNGANGATCATAALPTAPAAPTTGTVPAVTSSGGLYVTGTGDTAQVVGVGRTINSAGAIANTEGTPRQLFLGRILGFGDSVPATGKREHEEYWLSVDYDFAVGKVDAYLSASYGSQENDFVGGDLLTDRFTSALSGFGGPSCTNYREFSQASAADRRTMTPDANCEHYNPFSNALQAPTRGPLAGQANPNYEPTLANSAELLDWLVEPAPATLTTELFTVDFVVSSEFGNHGWAAGASFRDDRRETEYGGFNNRVEQPCQNEFVTDASLCPGDSGTLAFLSPLTPTDLSESVIAGFGEIQWNLLDDRLQIQTAARYEKYSDSGASLDPKLSVRFDATKWLTLRASVSTSFKAPQLAQIGLNDASAFSFIPQIGTFKAVDASTSPEGLDPESATAFNAGVVFQEGGFFASIDYWSLSLEDPIVNESFGGIVDAVCPVTPTAASATARSCSQAHALADRLVVTDAAAGLSGQPLSGAVDGTTVALTANSLNRVRVFVVNEEELKTSGIDANLKYTTGGLTLGVQWSHLNEYELSAYNPISDRVSAQDHVGQLNASDDPVRPLPEDKYQFSVNYEFTTGVGDFVIGGKIDYISDYEDERSTATILEVEEQTSLDLNLLYTPNQGRTTLFVNIDNVTDEEPPLAGLDISYDPYTHSPLGQSVKFGIVHRFTQ